MKDRSREQMDLKRILNLVPNDMINNWRIPGKGMT